MARDPLAEEDLGDLVNLFVEALDAADGVVERDGDDLVGAQRRHLTPLPLQNHLDGLDAEARGQHAVEGRGRAAALDVAEVGVARLYPGPVLYLLREVEADAAEPALAVDLLL